LNKQVTVLGRVDLLIERNDFIQIGLLNLEPDRSIKVFLKEILCFELDLNNGGLDFFSCIDQLLHPRHSLRDVHRSDARKMKGLQSHLSGRLRDGGRADCSNGFSRLAKQLRIAIPQNCEKGAQLVLRAKNYIVQYADFLFESFLLLFSV